MKLTVVLLTAGFLNVCANVRSQNVTFSGKAVTLESVFSSVEKQTGYLFLYTEPVLRSARPVSVDATNVPLETFLEEIFRAQPLAYDIKGKSIFVSRKEITRNILSIPPGPIRGRIVDEDGNPLAGASISIKGGKSVGVTDAGGMFSVNANAGDVLIITFVGFEQATFKITQTIAGRGTEDPAFSVTLKKSATALNEVTINKGYYMEKRRLSTGSVSTVRSKDIERQPVGDPLLALLGMMTGVEVAQNSGTAGVGVSIRVRGINSIGQGSQPLILVDGIPYPLNTLYGVQSLSGGGSALYLLNPADIESIDVLKDADATAIYGSRGAAGVILITTKKGKPGDTRLNVSFQSGWGKPSVRVDMLDAKQYLAMRHEALRNDGLAPGPFTYDLTLWDTTRHTDWQRTLVNRAAPYRDAQLSLSGGNGSTQYLFSTAYHHEGSVYPGDIFSNRVSGHMNLNNVSANQKFRFNFSGNYTIDQSQTTGNDITQSAMQFLAPVAPALYKPDGTLNWEPDAAGTSSWTNPIAEMMGNKVKNNTRNIVTNADVSYMILPGLELKALLGYFHIGKTELSTYPIATRNPATINPSNINNSRATLASNSRNYGWNVEPQIRYSKRFRKNTFDALIGSTFQNNERNLMVLLGYNFVSDQVMEDIRAAGTVSVNNTNIATYKYNALFGRLNYNYDDKYLVNFTMRRDGSSRFGPANQFHNFQSLGVAWIFSREYWIAGALPFLSFGKIRASFGTSGNDQVGDYTFMDIYSSLNYGLPYQGINALVQNRLFTPDLAWEETRKLEVAAELGFLRDRISLTTNYYRNRSTNQLVSYLLPNITGYGSIMKNLDAKLENSGIEIQLNTRNIEGRHFSWQTSFNISRNRNKLLSIAPGMSPHFLDLVGHSLGTTRLYRFLGVDPATGQYLFADSKGNPTFSPNILTDRTEMVDQLTDYFGGIVNTFTYKGLQLDVHMQFVKQRGPSYWSNTIPGYYSGGGYNQPVTVLDRWQKPGDQSVTQRFTTLTNNGIYASYRMFWESDAYYADASFLKVKNISLSYSFNESLIRKIRLRNLQLFGSAQNLFTFSPYQGLDPETKRMGGGTPLPSLRTITAGIRAGL